MQKSAARRQTPRFILSIQVSPGRAEEIDATARRLGITRHRLLTLAITAGMPAVEAAHQSPPDNHAS